MKSNKIIDKIQKQLLERIKMLEEENDVSLLLEFADILYMQEIEEFPFKDEDGLLYRIEIKRVKQFEGELTPN